MQKRGKRWLESRFPEVSWANDRDLIISLYSADYRLITAWMQAPTPWIDLQMSSFHSMSLLLCHMTSNPVRGEWNQCLLSIKELPWNSEGDNIYCMHSHLTGFIQICTHRTNRSWLTARWGGRVVKAMDQGRPWQCWSPRRDFRLVPPLPTTHTHTHISS